MGDDDNVIHVQYHQNNNLIQYSWCKYNFSMSNIFNVNTAVFYEHYVLH